MPIHSLKLADKCDCHFKKVCKVPCPSKAKCMNVESYSTTPLLRVPELHGVSSLEKTRHIYIAFPPGYVYTTTVDPLTWK